MQQTGNCPDDPGSPVHVIVYVADALVSVHAPETLAVTGLAKPCTSKSAIWTVAPGKPQVPAPADVSVSRYLLPGMIVSESIALAPPFGAAGVTCAAGASFTLTLV